MNITMIAGNVGQDCVVRQTQGGDSVASFTVAVDNGKDKNGNRRESTWFDCSLWGKRAEALAPYIKKGGKVSVSGRVSAREHNGKAYLQLAVNEITLQGGKSDSQGGYDQSPPAPSRSLDDEIPF